MRKARKVDVLPSGGYFSIKRSTDNALSCLSITSFSNNKALYKVDDPTSNMRLVPKSEVRLVPQSEIKPIEEERAKRWRQKRRQRMQNRSHYWISRSLESGGDPEMMNDDVIGLNLSSQKRASGRRRNEERDMEIADKGNGMLTECTKERKSKRKAVLPREHPRKTSGGLRTGIDSINEVLKFGTRSQLWRTVDNRSLTGSQINCLTGSRWMSDPKDNRRHRKEVKSDSPPSYADEYTGHHGHMMHLQNQHHQQQYRLYERTRSRDAPSEPVAAAGMQLLDLPRIEETLLPPDEFEPMSISGQIERLKHRSSRIKDEYCLSTDVMTASTTKMRSPSRTPRERPANRSPPLILCPYVPLHYHEHCVPGVYFLSPRPDDEDPASNNGCIPPPNSSRKALESKSMLEIACKREEQTLNSYRDDIDKTRWITYQHIERITHGTDFNPPRLVIVSSNLPISNGIEKVINRTISLLVGYDFSKSTYESLLGDIRVTLNTHKKDCLARSVLLMCRNASSVASLYCNRDPLSEELGRPWISFYNRYSTAEFADQVRPFLAPNAGCLDCNRFWRELGSMMSRLDPDQSFIHVLPSDMIGSTSKAPRGAPQPVGAHPPGGAPPPGGATSSVEGVSDANDRKFSRNKRKDDFEELFEGLTKIIHPNIVHFKVPDKTTAEGKEILSYYFNFDEFIAFTEPRIDNPASRGRPNLMIGCLPSKTPTFPSICPTGSAAKVTRSVGLDNNDLIGQVFRYNQPSPPTAMEMSCGK